MGGPRGWAVGHRIWCVTCGVVVSVCWDRRRSSRASALRWLPLKENWWRRSSTIAHSCDPQSSLSFQSPANQSPNGKPPTIVLRVFGFARVVKRCSSLSTILETCRHTHTTHTTHTHAHATWFHERVWLGFLAWQGREVDQLERHVGGHSGPSHEGASYTIITHHRPTTPPTVHRPLVVHWWSTDGPLVVHRWSIGGPLAVHWSSIGRPCAIHW